MSINYFHTNPFLCLMCVCFVQLHHFYQYYLCFMGRTYCIYSTDVWFIQVFFSKKDIVESKFFVTVNYSFNVRQTPTTIYVSAYWPLSVLSVFLFCVCVPACICVCVCVCVCVWYQVRVAAKKTSDLSKLDTVLHKTHSKGLLVLRY